MVVNFELISVIVDGLEFMDDSVSGLNTSKLDSTILFSCLDFCCYSSTFGTMYASFIDDA